MARLLFESTLIPRKLMQMLVIVLTLIATVTSGFAMANAAEQSSQYITITPSSNAIEVEPGASKEGNITIVNQGSDEFAVELSVSPYRVEGINYSPSFNKGEADVDPTDWVTLSKDSVDSLGTYKTLDVSYTVDVPSGIAPGGYYFVIFAESSPLKASKGVIAHNRVGQIVYLTVTGDFATEGSATAERLPAVTVDKTIKTSVDVTNSGDAHFVSDVRVITKNLFGTVISDTTEERFVLPDTTRRFVSTQELPGLFGIFTVERSATTPSGAVDLGAQNVVFVSMAAILIAASIVIVFVLMLVMRKKTTARK